MTNIEFGFEFYSEMSDPEDELRDEAETPEGVLKGALSALERQVRELRDRLRETWT